MSGPSLYATLIFLILAFLLFAIGTQIYQASEEVKASKPKTTKKQPRQAASVKTI